MKKIETVILQRLIPTIAAVILSLSTLLCLFSCEEAILTKEDLAANVADSSDEKAYDYVTLYLYDWDFPTFDTMKASWAEQVFKLMYNLKSGMPAVYDHAVLTAEYFLENYYDEIDLSDKKSVTDAVITSYVTVLGDPYSVYRTPVDSVEFEQNINGEFGGIGVTAEYDHTAETIMISEINIGSPAEKAGFEVGDYIIGVDGTPVSELGYLNAIYYIRGEKGTDVRITVKRGEKELTLTATRDTVKEISVAYDIDPDTMIAYIRISGFKGNTYEQFVEAVDHVKGAGAVGIIFDVRSNPGGLLSSVCDILSYLLPSDKTLVSYQYKNAATEVIKTADDIHPKTNEKYDSVINLPFVVLCNNYTASSGEIFTSVIRDYRNEGLINAAIVGTTTYKKGIAQRTYGYDVDGSSVTVTIAYYNPPSGENYHGKGVVPDVTVPFPDDAQTDVQYEAAVEEMKKLLNAN